MRVVGETADFEQHFFQSVDEDTVQGGASGQTPIWLTWAAANPAYLAQHLTGQPIGTPKIKVNKTKVLTRRTTL